MIFTFAVMLSFFECTSHLDLTLLLSIYYYLPFISSVFFLFLMIRRPPRSTRTEHTLPLHDALPIFPDGIPVMDTGAALAELKARFLSYGGDRPAIALAIRWCEDHLPAPADPVLVHGDYRMGNIMVDMAEGQAGGLAAVLDWELAHLGDGHEDLALDRKSTRLNSSH